MIQLKIKLKYEAFMSDQRKLFKKLIKNEYYLLQKVSSDQVVDIDSDSKYGVKKYKSIYLKSMLKGDRKSVV